MWNLEDYKNPLSARIHEKDFSKKLLGKGGKAYVFWLSDRKKVLKITVDDRDAKASAVVRDHPDKSLIHIYDVFQFGSTEFYGIVAEKLTPLTGSDYQEWEEVSDIITAYADRYDLPHWQGLTPRWVKEANEALPDLEDIVGKAFMNTFRAYLWQLTVWEEALTKRGITWSDLTPDNIMYRSRTQVISDVGRSRVKGSQRITKLIA